MKNKRGQTVFNNIVYGLVFIFVILIGINAYGSADGTWGGFFRQLPGSVPIVLTGFSEFLAPIFSALLGITSGDDSFIRIASFILIFIVVTATLDSVNLFDTGGGSGKLISFAIGMLVSAIGVRYMPDNMWNALTGPASAFVATILVGIPFLALLVITTKLKHHALGKAAWIFYILVLGYIVISPEYQFAFMWVYVVFLVLAVLMLFFDAQFRTYWNKQKYGLETSKMIGKLDVVKRHEIRVKIKEYYDVLADTDASDKDKKAAKKSIKDLQKLYGEDLSEI